MTQGNDGDGPTRRQLLGLLGAGGITAVGAGLIITGARVTPTNADDNESSDGGDEGPVEPSSLSVAWDATYGEGPSAFTAAAGDRSVPAGPADGENASTANGSDAASANGTADRTTDNATANGTADNATANESETGDDADPLVVGGVRSTGGGSGAGWLVGIEGPETTPIDATVSPDREGQSDGGSEQPFHAVERVIPSGDVWAVVGWTHEPSPAGDDAPASKYPWITVVDEEGEQRWQQRYERPDVESNRDVFHDGVPTADGGYLLAGVTLGAEFDDTRRGDGWLAKVGPQGELQWERTYAPDGADHASWSGDDRYDGFSTIRAIDGGYLLAGSATPEGPSNTNPADGWLLSVDESGERRWSSTYEFGGDDSDAADFSIEDVGPAGEGHFAVGTAGSYEYVRPIRENQLVGDGWVAGLDADGDVRWEQTLAGTSLRATVTAGDAGRIVAGARENRPWIGLVDGGGELVEELTLHEATGVVSAATVREDGAIALAGRRDDGETPVAFVTQLSPPESVSNGG